MRFERGIGVKKSLGIGMSFDNLQRGTILEITKSFSTDRWGEIQGHVEGWNKFQVRRYVIVRSTPHYEYDGKVAFRIRNAHTLDHAKRLKGIVLKEDEGERWNSRMKIEGMSRLQFNRRFKVVG